MAPDLTKHVPRSPFDELGGYAWLPRMIDKARATFAGTNGDYTPYPCPGDKQFLSFFGIDAGELGRLIRNGATDEEVAAYVKRTTKRTEAEIAAFSEILYRPHRNPVVRFVLGLYIKRKVARLQGSRPDVAPATVDTLGKLLAMEEGHPVPTVRR